MPCWRRRRTLSELRVTSAPLSNLVPPGGPSFWAAIFGMCMNFRAASLRFDAEYDSRVDRVWVSIQIKDHHTDLPVWSFLSLKSLFPCRRSVVHILFVSILWCEILRMLEVEIRVSFFCSFSLKWACASFCWNVFVSTTYCLTYLYTF